MSARVLGAQKIERQRLPFFEIDGVTYTIPDPIPKSVAIKALGLIRREGDYALADWLLEEVLDGDAYQALKTCDDITDEDIDWLFTQLSERVLGTLEKNLGKSGNGR